MFIFLIGINLISFGLFGVDKRRAKKRQFRISERTLWTSALFFGSYGAYAGMRVFRHKTKHVSFKVMIPMLMLFQTMILYLCFSHF